MVRLETFDDIAAQRGRLPDSLLDLAARRMRDVIGAFAEADAAWSADEYGPFVVLEAQDDFRDFRDLGLNPEEQGFLGALWEVTTWHPAEALWEVLILYGGDAGLTVFVPDAPWLDAELRAKLLAEAISDPTPDPGATGDRAPF